MPDWTKVQCPRLLRVANVPAPPRVKGMGGRRGTGSRVGPGPRSCGGPRAVVMNAIVELLRKYPELALFATLSLGYCFGQVKFRGVGLGTVASTLLVGVVIGLADVK